MKTDKEREAIARGNGLLAAVESSVDRVKSLDFPLGKFREAATAKAWAKNHGFPVRSASSSSNGFLVQVRPSDDFDQVTLVWESIGKAGVKALIGTLKRSAIAKSVPDIDASTEEKLEAQVARSEEFGIEAFVGLDEVLSFVEGGPQKLAHFGDPVNLLFPIDSGESATISRIAFRERAADYELEKSKGTVHERIVRAELDFGVEPSFDADDPLDSLLSKQLIEELTKSVTNLPETAFAKRCELIVVSKAANGDDVPDDEVRMFGIVMMPEVPDSDGTVTSHAEIEGANLVFMRDFGTTGFMHAKAISDKVSIVQNVIAPIDFEFPADEGGKAIAKGTWYQELWSNDPDIVKAVKVDKTLTGLSIGGWAKTVPVTEFVDGILVVNVPENYSPAQKRAIKDVVAKAEGDPALDRFVDLRVEEVSLVDAAANEEEFFIIKRRKEMSTKEKPAAAKKTETGATPAPEPTTKTPETAPEPTTPESSTEPTIADQIADGFERGMKSVLETVSAATPATPATETPAPAPATAPAPAATDDSPVLVELKKLNERMDGLESAQKKAGTARAVAKGEASPEETATPAETPASSSKWAGTAIHASFGKKQ